MARYFRFAASGFFASLAIAFVGLWVHSHQHHDVVSGPVGNAQIGAASNQGTVLLFAAGSHWKSAPWSTHSLPVSVAPDGYAGETHAGFALRKVNGGQIIHLYLPHWFVIASSLAVAALFAFKKSWRFTVRGLLIGTTIVATAMGLAVWAI